MKYIKQYENIDNKYKVGDYVLLDIEEIERENIRTASQDVPISELGLIIDIDLNINYPYIIKSISNKTCRIREVEIIRLLTPSEIDKFELTPISNKYNL